MADCRFEPTCGNLTELADMPQVQNIKKLLQLTVHSCVRCTHCTPKRTAIALNNFDQISKKLVAVGGFHNLIVNPIKIISFLG